MADQSQDIPIGTPVVALDGVKLGTVREVHDHYILIDQPDIHDDLEVPSDAVAGMENGALKLTVNRSALSPVDVEETAHLEFRKGNTEGG